MGRRIGALLGALAVSAVMVGGLAGPASADKVKDCGTTLTGTDKMYFTTTQTAACNSNSDTGLDTGPVTNSGGGTPPGQQP